MNNIVSANISTDCVRDDQQHADLHRLCRYNIALLKQMSCVIELLQLKAPASFNYSQAVGPHFRHVLEHYDALLTTVTEKRFYVDYDTRARNEALQNVPRRTLEKIQALIDQCKVLAAPQTLQANQPLKTRLCAGLSGEDTFTVDSSLARELLFVASHTVHHFALVGHYCKQAGIEVGSDFGKAPSTIAFERGQSY